MTATPTWWPIATYTLNFGDGSPTSTLSAVGQQPMYTSHPYPHTGTFQGSLTVTDTGGHSRTIPFSVAPHVTTVSASLSIQTSGASISISPNSTPPADSYKVDFGDGISSTLPPGAFNTTHTYANSGDYTVSLTAIYNGWTGTANQKITITVPQPPPPPLPQPVINRIAGIDRYATAISASRTQWPSSTASGVVLARGDQFPDALAGVPLAAHVHGPLLLTDPSALDAATSAEISRALGPDKSKPVYLLGGSAAASPAVEKQVRDLGYHVTRFGGADRFATALQIAQQGIGPTTDIVVATGQNFADALAAGPLAANRHAALVLSDGSQMDAATVAFVQAHGHIFGVGGPARDALFSQINRAGQQSHVDIAAGADRYDTAVRASQFFPSSGTNPVGFGVATGMAFPDALAGGAYMANLDQPLLLTDPAVLPASVIGDLSSPSVRASIQAVTIFGGPNAVSQGVEDQIAGTVGGRDQ
jgi:putative cell wall-binding protein